MMWLEQRLAEIRQAAESAFSQSALTILHRMFNDHVRMVERHPALAKVVFSDHLRVQFPSLGTKFAESTTPMSGVSLLCLSAPRSSALCPERCPLMTRQPCSYA
jgi:hypothetical protein